MNFRLLSESKPKARKNHVCDWCMELIKKSETYYRYTGNNDGDLQCVKMHLECQTAMNRDINDCDTWDYEFIPRDNPRGKTIAERENEQYEKTKNL